MGPERIKDPQEKANALKMIIHHYVAKSPVAIIPEEVKGINVWQIKVTNITGRVSSPTKSWQQALHISQPLNRGKHYSNDGALIHDDFADQPTDAATDNDSDASTGASENE